MISKGIIAAALALLMAGPAFASGCPNIMSAIDAALPTTQVSAADKEKVMKLRAKGEAEHKGGNHAASVATLTQAKTLLGM
jgi:hypothetical protein